MNCTDCQELLSVFLDGELDAAKAVDLRLHLVVCPECAALCGDFAAILETCHTADPAEVLPPNSRALWRRINNIIESEVKPEDAPQSPPKGWFARRLHFSFPQVGFAVLGIAFITSLLTIVGVRNYLEPTGEDYTSRSDASQTTFEKVLSKIGLIDTPEEARARRIREQRLVIEYWNKRVQARRAQWDSRLREAFDRNLNEIDRAVDEYTMILENDPQDELSGEMLDSALNEKMNLLRQFSEL